MFRHAGSCYVALPAHVAGPLPRITVSTAAPVASDQAVVVAPFWPGLDLALGVLGRGALDARCTAALGDLAPTIRSRDAAEATILRVSPVGEEERLRVRIIDRDYLTFTAELESDGDAIAQGTSGAFAFAAGRPIGMAITSDDPSRARFMRSEEIALNLSRFLTEQGVAFSAPSGPEADPRPEAGGTLALGRASSTTPPVLPQHGVGNLLGDGLYVFRPTGPVEIVLRLDGKAAAALRRLRLTAPAEGYAVPKDIVVQLDAGADGTRFRHWTQGQMRPDGVFDTGRLAGRNARWIKIVVRNAWGEGDVALDEVTAD